MEGYKRGAVFWYNNVNYTGSIQGGRRPIVIVSNNMANKYSRSLIAVPLTTVNKTDLPTHFKFRMNNKLNTALCEQVTSIDVKRLGRYITTVDQFVLKQIDEKLKVAMALK